MPGSGRYDQSPPVLVTIGSIMLSATPFTVDIPADPNTIELLISCDDTANSVYLRDTAATTAAGTKLGPGATAVLTTGAAVRVVNPNASNIVVMVNRIKNQ